MTCGCHATDCSSIFKKLQNKSSKLHNTTHVKIQAVHGHVMWDDVPHCLTHISCWYLVVNTVILVSDLYKENMPSIHVCRVYNMI